MSAWMVFPESFRAETSTI